MKKMNNAQVTIIRFANQDIMTASGFRLGHRSSASQYEINKAMTPENITDPAYLEYFNTMYQQ